MAGLVMPPFDRGRVLSAALLMAPALALGGFADGLLFVGLLELDALLVRPGFAAGFRASVHLLDTVLFGVLVIASLGALFATRDATRGLFWFSVATSLVIGQAVWAGWTFGLETVAFRIGLAIALWGLGWILLGLLLMALLRTTPHLRWVWVTAAVSVARGFASWIAYFVVFFMGAAWGGMLLVLVAVLALSLWFLRVRHAARAWSYKVRVRSHLPEPDRRLFALVLLYGIGLFGLIGTMFSHHFVALDVGAIHYALMFASAPAGAVLIGYVAETGGRRPVLYAVPLLVVSALILHAAFGAGLGILVAEGLVLGTIPFLLQYLAELTRTLRRVVVWIIAVGAVAAMGAGGSIAAQLPSLTGLAPSRLLLLNLGVAVVVLALAPLLPETRPDPDRAEALSEYLAMARRLQGTGDGIGPGRP